MTARSGAAAALWLLAMACSKSTSESKTRRDPHSFSNPEQVQVRFLDLDLDVRFDRKILHGIAKLTIERWTPGSPLILDTRDLRVEKVEQSRDGSAWAPAQFELGKADSILGAPLTIHLRPAASLVRVTYSTSPRATALQWLDAPQTAGKQYPFLFTQSQAIHARSWIPLQDSPGVRIGYRARVNIRVPGRVGDKPLRAVMSAITDPSAGRTGTYSFMLSHRPIPSYLIALAVGDLEYRSLGPRTGVWAEKPLIDRAAKEFEDTEQMLRSADILYDRYRWGRYDLLILPPSFPYGGMENPTLTFLTPTILAGDKSLVALVAHELAHSWSGNLVSNATWADFWLNEGFTTYVERRIIEAIYGRERAATEAVLGRRRLEAELARLPARDQILHIDLKGRDPDDGATDIPYEKGALFLRTLEEVFTREKLDGFLRRYFNHFAFNSITTGIFKTYLKKHLLDPNPSAAAKVPVDDWLYKPGIPAGAAQPSSKALAKVEAAAQRWLDGGKIETAKWSTQEWLHFLESLPKELTPEKMRALDRDFAFSRTGNSEILHTWLLMAVRNRYSAAYTKLEEFLTSMGRRKYLKPLYEELVKTPEGRQRAAAIYEKARPTYHPIAQTTVDAIVRPSR